ncbi:MAG: hypothetical protein IJ661_05610 [Lachnospiraceae bacterium]|nr:hypothetical protein [Lachnospiraceae bacterium]
MAEKYIMIHDILSEHRDRMLNLKKYYPFFVLSETTFTQYKEGKYADLDMGYITMATLRFLIHENNFQEQEVTYEQYEDFLLELLHREFGLSESEEEEKELAGYIFDKIKNEGKAFTFTYFDPEEKKKKTARVKLIDSRIADGVVLYRVTTDGIEFYLDTKEIKDESNISVQQLLLEKMIQSENFAGGIEVVKRINNEVSKLSLQKKEVLDLLSYDIIAGAKASEEFMETVAKWFDEESRLFEKNRALIDKAFSKANSGGFAEGGAGDSQADDYIGIHNADGTVDNAGSVKQGGNSSGFGGGVGINRNNTVLAEIHKLDTELKKTIIRHGELIRETIQLQNIADEMIGRAKLRKLRPVFDFRNALNTCMKEDAPHKLSMMVMPLFLPKLTKSFNVESIDWMLESRADSSDYGEKVEKKELDPDFRYDDEIEEERINGNYGRLFEELLEQLWKHGHTTLSELMAIYEIKFGKEIYTNGDVYSFLVHLAQKDRYDMGKMQDKQDTFLEGIVMESLSSPKKDQYGKMVFTITYNEEEVLRFGAKDEYSVTDMSFAQV